MSLTPYEQDSIFAVVYVLLGLVSLFLGFRLFRIIAGLFGFFIFGAIGYVIVYYFIYPSLIASIIVASVFGVIGGILLVYFFVAGVFMIGSFVGFCTSLFIISMFESEYMNEDDVRDIVVVALSLIGGLIALRFRNIAVIICTSLIGSYGVVFGMDQWILSGYSNLYDAILDRQLTSTHMSALLICIVLAWLAVAAIGSIVQLKFTAKDIELESTTGGIKVPSFFGKKKPATEDHVPLLEVISYLEDEPY
eukprot:TRINITY_DN155_c0_g1_i2.p1 TRINITY_DN155_c0_g1~~TRINITY_DN155_c0_g1_i2.p1  ORF type:complete len:273 (+),score=67.45 TRINITY_DN155_c0_g1_i2:70-819(+)